MNRKRRRLVIWQYGDGPYLTKKGTLITDDQIAEWAEEAERGYDVSHLVAAQHGASVRRWFRHHLRQQ